MRTFAERIRYLRDKYKLTQEQVGEIAGVTKQAVTQWESGESEPTQGKIRKLAIHFNVDFDWLTTGRGSENVAPGLPLRGNVAAGVWHEIFDNQDIDLQAVPVAPDPRFPREFQYALRVEGQSINKIAQDGSILTCVDLMGSGLEPRDGDLVVVERRRGQLVETTVKRLRKGTRSLELWPESNDPSHQEKLTIGRSKADSEIIIKALVIWVSNQIARGA